MAHQAIKAPPPPTYAQVVCIVLELPTENTTIIIHNKAKSYEAYAM